MNLVGSRLSATGSLLNPAGTLLVPAFSAYLDQALAHDGTNWWLVWGAAEPVARAARERRRGPAGPGRGRGPADHHRRHDQPGLCAAAGRASGRRRALAWYDLPAPRWAPTPTCSCCRSAPPTCRASSAAPRPARATSASPTWPRARAAAGPLVYVSEHANDDQSCCRCWRRRAGAGRGAGRGAPAPVIGRARVAWNGSQFLVTWDQGASGSTPTAIKARRLPAMAAFRRRAALRRDDRISPDVEALGGDFLVAAARFDTYPQFIYTWMRIIDGGTGAFRNAPTSWVAAT